MSLGWRGTESSMHQQSWTCGYCGKSVGGNVGYRREDINDKTKAIYICPYCENPTAFIANEFGSIGQYPGSIIGTGVNGLPETVAALYEEIRRCVQYHAFTSAVLASRKLLMHIAVEQGASENMKFIEYVEYLEEIHYIPPNGGEWVDEIRKRGNEATHEIVIMAEDDAIQLLDFCEMLLKFIYEFPSRIKHK